jgi:hypothetical protein
MPLMTDADDPARHGIEVKYSTVGGDLVGRDKIVNNIQNIVQRAATAVEEAVQARSVEMQLLAEGVSTFVQQLQTRANDGVDGATPYKGLLEYRLNDFEIFFWPGAGRPRRHR